MLNLDLILFHSIIHFRAASLQGYFSRDLLTKPNNKINNYNRYLYYKTLSKILLTTVYINICVLLINGKTVCFEVMFLKVLLDSTERLFNNFAPHEQKRSPGKRSRGVQVPGLNIIGR